mgnify:CR=1 FL=1
MNASQGIKLPFHRSVFYGKGIKEKPTSCILMKSMPEWHYKGGYYARQNKDLCAICTEVLNISGSSAGHSSI